MVKVVLVGCGFMGRMHGNVIRTLDGAELLAAVDITSEAAEAYAREFGIPVYATLEEALGKHECDAVDVCLPTYLHREFTEKAAAAGKHVFCEKPMALTVADADAMIAACERAGVQLMVGHCIRFWPEYALLKQIATSGRLGKLLSVNLTRYGAFPNWSWDNWLASESRSGGGALDMHIHDTDFALYLLGEPLNVVSHGTEDERGVGQIFTTLKYPGTVCHLEGGWNLPGGTPFKMAFRAIFSDGAMIMDGGPLTIYQGGEEPEVPEFERMEAAGGGNISDLGGYYHELKYFADCLNSGKPFETTTPASSRRSLELALQEIALVRAANG